MNKSGCVFALFTFVLLVNKVCYSGEQPTDDFRCQDDQARQAARSEELQKLVNADQEDRVNWRELSQEDWVPLRKRDEVRRKRVAEIFAEGCFVKPEDYAAAALIFQHGTSPDHFFQTFIWSKRGVELGDLKQKRMAALGIDRYLLSLGHKQLFGSQALYQDGCWCLAELEDSFPNELRLVYFRDPAESYAWLGELNQSNACLAKQCPDQLKSSPQGIVPGLW